MVLVDETCVGESSSGSGSEEGASENDDQINLDHFYIFFWLVGVLVPVRNRSSTHLHPSLLTASVADLCALL